MKFNMMKKIYLLFCAFFSIISAFCQIQVRVHLSPKFTGPLKGRLMIYTLSDTSKQFGANPDINEAAFALDVKDWNQGQVITFAQQSDFLNRNITQLVPGLYKMIAILDTNTHERGTFAEGNLFTREETIIDIKAGKNTVTNLVLDRLFPKRVFKENDSIRELSVYSPLLSEFRKESIFMKAAVVLPKGYDKEKSRIYPVVYIIPGWGGVHYQALSAAVRKTYGVGLGEAKIFVFLNPESQTPFGLHGFVDSRVNGPWSKALTEELIPHFQKQFRASTDPDLNFLAGQSTGGYSAVYLSLYYPRHFGGAWATSPDPLDFRSFTGVNLYEDKNFFISPDGRERGFNLVDGKFISTLRVAKLTEDFEGEGGQQQSFEAVFGIPGKNGRPQSLYDASNGNINKNVFVNWKRYDLSAYAKRNAKILKKYMHGRVEIYVGGKDNFLLNKSALAFSENINNSGLPITISVLEKEDHFSVRGPSLTLEISRQMDEVIKNKKQSSLRKSN